MPQQKVSFTGAGNERLAASLETPADAPRAYALFAHCFTCTKDIFSARYVAAGLAARGFAVLRFDFTGLGASEGDFANTNFSSNVGDLLAAAKFLREEYEAPRLLVGHSLGGAAVLAAAGDIPECRAVATIGAPSEPGHVAKLFTDHQDKIRVDGEAEVLLSGRPFKIRKQFLEDIEGARLAEKIRNLQRALIVFHSATDKTVEIANARAIFEAARHPKTFVSWTARIIFCRIAATRIMSPICSRNGLRVIWICRPTKTRRQARNRRRAARRTRRSKCGKRAAAVSRKK